MTHLDPRRRATRSELRSFGLLVGGAFLAVAGLIAWRAGTPLHAAVITLAALGAALVITGAVLPVALGPVYTVWMRLAILLSRVTTPILMGAIYFLLLTPLGLFMRVVGRDPLRSRVRVSGWVQRAPGQRASALERQF